MVDSPVYECIGELLHPSVYDRMSRKEARAHFKWFIANKDRIIEELDRFYFASSGKHLDYSAESLADVWDWCLDNVLIVPKTKAELKQEFMESSEFNVEHILTTKIDEVWMYIIRDIYIYLSECLVRKFSSLRWDIQVTAKTYIGFNMPGIYGFRRNTSYFPHGNSMWGDSRCILLNEIDKDLLRKKFIRLGERVDA